MNICFGEAAMMHESLAGSERDARGRFVPGQSGNPDDAHYRDLFPLWSTDRFFAVPYIRVRVMAASEKSSVLIP